MKKQTHETRLLSYLLEHDEITSLEAIRDLGNTRLSSSVFILKKDGHLFETKSVKVANRFGGLTKVARYKLIK